MCFSYVCLCAPPVCDLSPSHYLVIREIKFLSKFGNLSCAGVISNSEFSCPVSTYFIFTHCHGNLLCDRRHMTLHRKLLDTGRRCFAHQLPRHAVPTWYSFQEWNVPAKAFLQKDFFSTEKKDNIFYFGMSWKHFWAILLPQMFSWCWISSLLKQKYNPITIKAQLDTRFIKKFQLWIGTITHFPYTCSLYPLHVWVQEQHPVIIISVTSRGCLQWMRSYTWAFFLFAFWDGG